MIIYFTFILFILSISHTSSAQENIKTQNEFDFSRDNDSIYFNSDDDYYIYIKKEYEYVKNNKIKFIKIGDERQEYYNVDGELTKVEYLDSYGNVFGWLDFYKFDSKYFYKLHDVDDDWHSNDYSEVSGEYFVSKGWPLRQTIFYDKLFFAEGKLYAKYGYGDPNIYLDFYSYSSYEKIYKVLSYLIENLESDSIESFKDLPKLLSIHEYKYNSDSKLVEIETKNPAGVVTSIIKLKYNERGLVEENEKGEKLEYEYYK